MTTEVCFARGKGYESGIGGGPKPVWQRRVGREGAVRAAKQYTLNPKLFGQNKKRKPIANEIHCALGKSKELWIRGNGQDSEIRGKG